jgi:hypothetical protein
MKIFDSQYYTISFIQFYLGRSNVYIGCHSLESLCDINCEIKRFIQISTQNIVKINLVFKNKICKNRRCINDVHNRIRKDA